MTRVSDDLLCVVSRARVILYDFDGPLCDVFAGLPAALAAQQAGQLIGADFETDDPLEVLRLAVARGIDAATAEDAVIAVEKAAIDCARATSGGIESVRLALSKGCRVGIVSNNSSVAIHRFIRRVGMSNLVELVVGRPYGLPSKMKPHPWSLISALSSFGVQADRTVFVGDSATDIEAAVQVGVPCIAYANKPEKRDLFEPTGAVVIDSMWNLNDAIDAVGIHRANP